MQQGARLQAAIEILDDVIAATRDQGAAADNIIQRYFRSRRYAGSGDRAAIRELVFAAIRFTAERPASGRMAMLGLAEALRPDLLPLFDGSRHAPPPPAPDEPRSTASLCPPWLRTEMQQRFGADLERQLQALIERAPLDLRVNKLRADIDEVAAALEAKRIPDLPLGLRLAEARSLQNHPLMQSGAIEVQDAGSQTVVQMADATAGETVIDLCAGAGGKTLALAVDMAKQGRLLATDVNRARLQAMAPRLQRAGLDDFVETRLLNPGAELQALQDFAGMADLVLVDAPCSGTGTWRRNPELRWRLSPHTLARTRDIQAQLMQIGAALLKPGGRLVYAVCSVLPSEGSAQMNGAHGLDVEATRQLTPASHGTDGFFIARLRKSR